MKLQMMYKIIHGIVDLKLPDYITFNSNITRGHNYRLTIPPQRIDAYKFSFSHQQSPNGIDFQPVLSMLPQLILLLT